MWQATEAIAIKRHNRRKTKPTSSQPSHELKRTNVPIYAARPECTLF